jgi:hypothetical protein
VAKRELRNKFEVPKRELGNQPFMFQRNTQNHEIMVGGASMWDNFFWAGTEARPTSILTFKAVFQAE